MPRSAEYQLSSPCARAGGNPVTATSRLAAAAKAMGITAERLLALGLIDGVIEEPLGGAHRNPDEMSLALREVLANALAELLEFDTAALIARRADRLAAYGDFREA